MALWAVGYSRSSRIEAALIPHRDVIPGKKTWLTSVKKIKADFIYYVVVAFIFG
jgi:hypothetical protein